MSRSPRKLKAERLEERGGERNNCVNIGNYVCLAARLQRHPGSAHTSLGPKTVLFLISVSAPLEVNMIGPVMQIFRGLASNMWIWRQIKVWDQKVRLGRLQVWFQIYRGEILTCIFLSPYFRTFNIV